MTSWRAAKAKAEFSAVLDCARDEGPQLVTRRKEEFLLVTRAEWKALAERAGDGQEVHGQNLWEMLHCPPEDGDPELILPVREGGSRAFEF